MPSSRIIASHSAQLNKFQLRAVERLYGLQIVDGTVVERISYLSEGLKINGYMASPKTAGRYPVLLWNRGGDHNNGALDDLTAYLILASTAQWGYLVVGTQYRGNMGSEGEEDWAGRDVYDSLNFLEAISAHPMADMNRLAIEGASRGGMTTYRALALEHRFKCAIVHAGISDLFLLEKQSDKFAKFIDQRFGHLPPEVKQREMANCSGVHIAERFNKNCPILLMHGDVDSRVPIEHSLSMDKTLTRLNHPHKFVIVKNGGHIALKDGSYKEIDEHRKAWLKEYLDSP